MFATQSHAKHQIYIVHGHGGYKAQMNPICNALVADGQNAQIFSYRSLKDSISQVVQQLLVQIRSDRPDTVSFVTFSMGAMVVRMLLQQMQQDATFPAIDKIVMIAAPNKGTPVADYFYKCKIARWIAGPNLKELTVQYRSDHPLPVPDNNYVLILGIRNTKKGYNRFLKTDNDGYVIPEKAILGTEKAIYYVHASHNALPGNKNVINHVREQFKSKL